MANLYRTPLPTKQRLFSKIPKSRTTTRLSIPSPWTSRSLSTLSWGEWWSWSQRWWPGWRNGSGSSNPRSLHTNRQTGHPKTRCVSFSHIEHNCDIPIEFNPSTMTITNNSCHCSTISIVLIQSIPVLIHISISTTKSLSSAFLLCTDEIIGKFFINFSCMYYNHLSTVEFDITTFFRQRYSAPRLKNPTLEQPPVATVWTFIQFRHKLVIIYLERNCPEGLIFPWLSKCVTTWMVSHRLAYL